MVSPPQPGLYAAARRVLLDAFEALEDHLDSLVLVGAQAVYLRAGQSTAVADPPYTTDGDLRIDPRNLADHPLLAERLPTSWPTWPAPGSTATTARGVVGCGRTRGERGPRSARRRQRWPVRPMGRRGLETLADARAVVPSAQQARLLTVCPAGVDEEAGFDGVLAAGDIVGAFA